MKNLKKIAALGAATVMAMSMSVSAFAAASQATATYENGAVKLSSLADIDDSHQWTVVVIDAAKATSDLTADDLYYINQGTSGEYFWTNGMGTKIDLADGQHDGDYLVRIGGETITDAQGIIEIPLTVSTGPVGPTYKLGDVNNDTLINLSDVLATLDHYLGVKLLEGDSLLAADVAPKGEPDGTVNLSDVLGILDHYLGVSSVE